MDQVPSSKSRLLNRQTFEAEYQPLKWRTVIGWEKEGLIKVIRWGRKLLLDRNEIESVLAQGGKRFLGGWRKDPV